MLGAGGGGSARAPEPEPALLGLGGGGAETEGLGGAPLPRPGGGGGGPLLGGPGGLLSAGGGGGGRLERLKASADFCRSAGVGGGALLGGGGGGALLAEGGGGIGPREGGGAELRLGGGKPGAERAAPPRGLAKPRSVFCRGADGGTPGPTLGRDFFARPSNTSRSDPPLSLILRLLSPSTCAPSGAPSFDSISTYERGHIRAHRA